jgi:DNA-binding IclR family transcriptional regulator
LQRALAVLGAMSGSRQPLSVTEVASRCGLPVATVHRLISQLEDSGMVRRSVGSRRVLVGPALVQLARGVLESALMADSTHRILAGLASRIGEDCQIGICADGEVLYVDTARVVRSGSLHFEAGRRSPLHCTSIGKLFLAEMPEASLMHWIGSTPLSAPTPQSVVERKQLLQMVAQVRAEAWAASNEEFVQGVVGCAVPVRGPDGSLLAGLGISVPSARVAFSALAGFRPALEKAAKAIAQDIFRRPR